MHLYYTELVLITYVYTVHTHTQPPTHTPPSGRNPTNIIVYFLTSCAFFFKKKNHFSHICNHLQ